MPDDEAHPPQAPAAGSVEQNDPLMLDPLGGKADGLSVVHLKRQYCPSHNGGCEQTSFLNVSQRVACRPKAAGDSQRAIDTEIVSSAGTDVYFFVIRRGPAESFERLEHDQPQRIFSAQPY